MIRNKKITTVLFVFGIFFICFPAFVFPDDIGWPEKIISPVVEGYVFENHSKTKNNHSGMGTRDEYVRILDFLSESVNVHAENIVNYCNNKYGIRKEPTLIDGDFGFKNVGSGLLILNSEREVIREVANISSVTEYIDLIVALETYNQFVEQCFIKTGEILGEKYDVKEEIEKLNNLFNETNNETERVNLSGNGIIITEETMFGRTIYNKPFIIPLDGLTNLDGSNFDKSLLNGKYVLLNLGATWNPRFSNEKKSLQELYIKYNTGDKFAILAVSLGEGINDVKNFMTDNKYTFPIVVDKDNGMRNDFAPVIPVTYLVNPEGFILMRFNSEMEWMDETISNYIDTLLAPAPLHGSIRGVLPPESVSGDKSGLYSVWQAPLSGLPRPYSRRGWRHEPSPYRRLRPGR
ncbi:MAG: TlpA family protein disulfide reductase [Treponema sp.]|jgi:hypothetical protein|nr:TlpA family protein disulfide reductase [Treponema sp.]